MKPFAFSRFNSTTYFHNLVIIPISIYSLNVKLSAVNILYYIYIGKLNFIKDIYPFLYSDYFRNSLIANNFLVIPRTQNYISFVINSYFLLTNYHLKIHANQRQSNIQDRSHNYNEFSILVVTCLLILKFHLSPKVIHPTFYLEIQLILKSTLTSLFVPKMCYKLKNSHTISQVLEH